MAIPHRGNTGLSTYFITSATWCKRPSFQTARMAELLVQVMFHYRDQGRYQLHEFVVMPDHIHLLVTPSQTLEKAIQLIKGGYSFRAKKELGFQCEIWEHSFHDRRVRDLAEYYSLREYIHVNPVRRGLVQQAEQYAYSSASGLVMLDAVPQRLKPTG